MHQAYRQLNFEDLWILVAFARGKGMVEAARELRVTVPAITGRLHKLEAVFGTTIMEQRGRTKFLTETGQRLACMAKKMLCLLEGAEPK